MNIAEWVVLGILAGLAVYDLKTKKVPVLAVVLFGAIVLGCRLWNGISIVELLAGLVPGAVLLLAAYGTRGGIGSGDGMVLCVLGMFCGMQKTLAVFSMALVLSAVLAIVLLTMKRAGRKTELPFLPCLCAGYILCLLW